MFNKKQLVLTVCALALHTMSIYGISRTFFRPRSITTDATYELAMSNYLFYKHHLYDCDQDSSISFFATPFYQKSRGNNLANYFFPGNRSSVSIIENGNGDINSLFLGLIAPTGQSFNSTLRMCPERSVFGAYLQAWVDLSCWCDHTWLSISFAAMRAKHDLRLRESNNTNNGTLVIPATSSFPQPITIMNALDALDNPLLGFGRFSRCPRKHGGVDDIQFKIGRDWLYNCDMNHISLYVVATAPTGRCNTGRYIFEPLVGSRNGSLGFGINADYLLWEGCDSIVTAMLDVKYRYVFKACERRSFDLVGRDWSRFIPIILEGTPGATLFGLNNLPNGAPVFTQCVKVKPRSTIDLWAALHWEACAWHAEIGYNFWYRQAECISNLRDLPANVSFLDLAAICGTLVSASTETINQTIAQVTSDATFTNLTATGLNASSGAHPRAISHKIYGTIGYEYTDVCPLFECISPEAYLISIGGSYEFGDDCATLDNWAVWAKLGVTF